MTHTCAIVVPVYKADMSVHEKASFSRCLEILGSRPVYLLTHGGVDLAQYRAVAGERGVELRTEIFGAEWFDGVGAYNRLMLECSLYERFSRYAYILVHQLDAWVFSDQLDRWCAKGYDYVGAPWFEDYSTHEAGKELWAVGNGGLSLRRVAYYLKVLGWKGTVYSHRLLPVDLKMPVRALRMLGRHNTIDYLKRSDTRGEDSFICVKLEGSALAPRVPSPLEAAEFAFEKSPSYLYRLIGGRLPMGCHAYHKHEYAAFWQKHIK